MTFIINLELRIIASKIMNARIILMFFLFLLRNADAQKEDSVLITRDTDLGGIGWLDQFTFIHHPPKNKVDHWVKKIEKFGKYDTLQIVRFVEELAGIQSKESYALLYLMCCQPMNIKHLTAFNSFAAMVQALNGFRVLNKYYLQNAVLSNMNRLDFNNAVILKCQVNPPPCFYRK